MLNDGQKIDALNEIIKESEHIVFLAEQKGKRSVPEASRVCKDRNVLKEL